MIHKADYKSAENNN